MKLRFWNSNYVGTHFGGSLYSMCDPFYMIMVLENLGSEYIVWDKSASIRFKKPGKGVVTATFDLTQEQLDEIINATANGEKCEPVFEVLVKDREGDVVCQIEKKLYVKRKDALGEKDAKTDRDTPEQP
jgi:hypothetical protein